MSTSELERSLQLDLPAVPQSCPRVRDEVRQALAGLSVDVAAAELAVTEAVTNAVVHAYRDRDVAAEPGRVRVSMTVDAEGVWLLVADDGVAMYPRPDSPGLGIGLSLMGRLCAQLLIVESDSGTRVHLRFSFGA